MKKMLFILLSLGLCSTAFADQAPAERATTEPTNNVVWYESIAVKLGLNNDQNTSRVRWQFEY